MIEFTIYNLFKELIMKEENIVLISPRVLGAKEQIRKAPPPFGIAVLAASLNKIGYGNIHLIDAVVEDLIIDVNSF